MQNPSRDFSCSSSLSSPAATWARILGMVVDRGRSKEAMALFRQMQHEGIALDRRMFVALGSAAAAARDLDQGKVIHRCAQESGHCHDSQLATAFINMYGKCGDIRSARIVFDGMPAPGVVAWTALISAHSESREISPGSSEDAIHLFRLMQLQGVAPNAVTFLAILSNCNNLRLGIWIHTLYDDSRTGTEEEVIDVVVGTALVAMYGRVGCSVRAASVFLVMPEKNTVTWNTMITAYAQNGHSKEALGVYWKMLLDGQHKPSKVTFLGVIQACQSPQFLVHGRSIHFQSIEMGMSHDAAVATTIVSMYGKCGSLDEAREVFAEIQNRDSACWTAMIGACADNGDSSSSLMLFRKMELEGIPARKVTSVAVLNACAADSSFLEVGRALHKRVAEMGFISDTMVANALLSMYGKSGKLKEAWKIFLAVSSSVAWNSSAILVSWNTLIAAFAMHCDPAITLELFQMMLLEGVAADGRTFMGMLDGCTHTGCVEQGCFYFGLMSDHWIFPEKEHYGCLADLLGRAGWLLEAEEFIKKMPASVVDDFKWMSLLGACKMHGDVSRAERAAKRAVQLNSRNSAAAYVALSSVYVDLESSKHHRP